MSQTGRADLLLALSKGGDAELVIEDDGRHRWAYVPVVATPAPAQPGPRPLLPDPVPMPASAPSTSPHGAAAFRLPLRMPSAWVMEPLPMRDIEAEVRDAPLLSAQDLLPLASAALPCLDLVPWARVMPGLRRHSDAVVEVGIDWHRLMYRLARRDVPRRLPRRVDRRWPDHLVLALDVCPRLDPYGEDFERLARRFTAQLPAGRLSVRSLKHGPAGGWRPWANPKDLAELYRPTRRGEAAWQLPHGATVVVASDLGWFGGVQARAIHQQWLAWGRIMRRQGARVIVLAPVSPSLMTQEALQLFDVIRWSPDSRWQPERQADASMSQSNGEQAPAATRGEPLGQPLAQLLAMAAPAIRVDPPLLRTWRQLVAPGGDAGLEGQLWNHPHVSQQAMTCSVRAEVLDDHLNANAALPEPLRQAARTATQADHAHLRRAVAISEALRADADAADGLDFIKRLLHGLAPNAGLAPTDRAAHLRLAQFVQASAISRVRARDPALFAALDALVASNCTAAKSPDAPVAEALTGHWQWTQQGARIFLDPSGSSRPGQRLGEPFELRASVPEVWANVRDVLYRQPARRGDFALPAVWLEAGQVEIGVGPWRWRLHRVESPPWVEAFGVRDGTPFFSHLTPDDGMISWQPHVDLAEEKLPSGIALAVDAFGLCADLTLQSLIPAQFRVRYIPPGQFLMGSHEGVSRDDERPQHPVTMTVGYWLADTPCTQALWHAVMGDNPSEFKDGSDAAERPVDNVSWDEVQIFLQRLRKLLPPGCDPTLPTEAQWEYAARAGTRTAYWWGDEFDATKANAYINNDRDTNGSKGATTPVRHYPPNPWGLHDVYGNVWEWCLDDQRKYGDVPVRDPHGDLESALRAVRGGSWFDGPDCARSAFRHRRHRDRAIRGRGFRLTLRTPGPVAGVGGTGQGGGPEGPVNGVGRPGTGGALLDRLAGGLAGAIGGLFVRKGGKKK